MADTKHEADAVRRLLDTLGEPYANVADPKRLYGHETGADVQIEHSGRKVGIQEQAGRRGAGAASHPRRAI